jgi:glycogen debranching enzyme
VIASWSAEVVGNFDVTKKLVRTMLDTAEAFSFQLPELLCGFQRVNGVPPVPYKSANPLHAWAAGAALGAVQSALGIRVDAAKSEVIVDSRALPLEWAPITVLDLEVKFSRISFVLEPDSDEGLRLSILKQEGLPVILRHISHGLEQTFGT